jgi:hypothetical protein
VCHAVSRAATPYRCLSRGEDLAKAAVRFLTVEAFGRRPPDEQCSSIRSRPQRRSAKGADARRLVGWDEGTMTGFYATFAGKLDEQVLDRPQGVAVTMFRVLEGDFR